MLRKSAMYNLKVSTALASGGGGPGGGLLAADPQGVTPRTPEILNSLMAMTHPLDPAANSATPTTAAAIPDLCSPSAGTRPVHCKVENVQGSTRLALTPRVPVGRLVKLVRRRVRVSFEVAAVAAAHAVPAHQGGPQADAADQAAAHVRHLGVGGLGVGRLRR